METQTWLIETDEGQAYLRSVAQQVGSEFQQQLDRLRLRGRKPDLETERKTCALELFVLRAKACEKFDRADQMWLDQIGLQQATRLTVARWKARRFSDKSPVYDLCSGLGGDAIALAEAGSEVIACEADHERARRLRWNLGVYQQADRVQIHHRRAQSITIPESAWIHIDPDRRHQSQQRARWIEDFEPPLPFLEALIRRQPGCALKVGPASNFDRLDQRGASEVELISDGHECREATIWTGQLATVSRRASILPAALTWTDRDDPDPTGGTVIGPVEDYLYDPDPALSRAGLLDGFARAHGLRRIHRHHTLLSGRERLNSPWLKTFGVLDVLPERPKLIRAWLRQRGGIVDTIKSRGRKIDDRHYRKQINPDKAYDHSSLADRVTLVLVDNSPAKNLAIMTEPVSA